MSAYLPQATQNPGRCGVQGWPQGYTELYTITIYYATTGVRFWMREWLTSCRMLKPARLHARITQVNLSFMRLEVVSHAHRKHTVTDITKTWFKHIFIPLRTNWKCFRITLVLMSVRIYWMMIVRISLLIQIEYLYSMISHYTILFLGYPLYPNTIPNNVCAQIACVFLHHIRLSSVCLRYGP